MADPRSPPAGDTVADLGRDFASAAMLRVLAQGMRDLGWRPDPDVPPGPSAEATVPLDAKRRLVGSALAQGGHAGLALLGQGLHRLAHEPTHRALVSSRDAGDLLARWARLERYIHSRHRIELRALDAQGVQLAHVARPGCPAPLPAEDLVVLGVLAALLQAMGATEVRAEAGGASVLPQPDVAALEAAVRAHRTADWRLSWTGLAEHLPRGLANGMPTSPPPPLWPEDAQRCYTMLAADLMQPPRLPDLARMLDRAPRSLQRGLQSSGLSYTRVLAEARCRTAAAWLLQTQAPVAEVGYVCGYADQPHFTRDFRRRVGMTPLHYRRDFGLDFSAQP